MSPDKTPLLPKDLPNQELIRQETEHYRLTDYGDGDEGEPSHENFHEVPISDILIHDVEKPIYKDSKKNNK